MMSKRKAEVGWVEGPKVRTVGIEPTSIEVAAERETTAGIDCQPGVSVPTGLVATPADTGTDEVADPEGHVTEVFWRLLELVGYEHW